MGGWYLVTKRIKGRPYHYRQRTWREGATVRTESQYLGPASSASRPVRQASRRGRRRSALTTKEACDAWDAGELAELKPADLSSDSLAALRDYSRNGYEAWNQALRGTLETSDALLPGLFAISEALEHPAARLKHDVILYRKCIVPLNKYNIGDDFIDEALMSFSADIHAVIAHSVEPPKDGTPAILHLKGHKGDAGYLPMSEISIFPSEKEVLRQGGKFIVLDTSIENGYIYLIIEEVL